VGELEVGGRGIHSRSSGSGKQAGKQTVGQRVDWGSWLGLGQEHGGIAAIVLDLEALRIRLLSIGGQLL